MKEKILETLAKSAQGRYTYRNLKLLLKIPDDEVSPERTAFNDGIASLAEEGKLKHFTLRGKTHIKLIRNNTRNAGRPKGPKVKTQKITFDPLPKVLEAYQGAENKGDFINNAVLAYIGEEQ